MIKRECNYRVLYAHTDKMGIASNTRYLEYFEVGRVELLRQIGYPYKKMEDENIGLPLIQSYCEYISPAYYDDNLKIVAFICQKPTAKIRIDYEIYKGNNIITKGYTTHCFINLISMKPVKPSKRFLEIINNYFE